MRTMKAIAILMMSALCGGAWAQGSAYTTPGGTRHYNGPHGYHGSSYTTPGGTTHYRDNQGRTGTSYTTPGGTTHYSGNFFDKK